MFLSSSFRSYLRSAIRDTNDVQRIERQLKLTIPGWAQPGSPDYIINTALPPDAPGSDLALDVVDNCLFATELDDKTRVAAAWRLSHSLLEGGSAYEIAPDVQEDGSERMVLQDRIDPTTRAAAEEVMNATKPGQYLRKAWGEIYGRGPDPSSAYHHAVNAVEAAAGPVVTPNDADLQLGKIVGALRDAPAGKFEVALKGKHDAADSVDVVRLMAQLLWTHDHKRHGDPDPDKPIQVDQKAAEAAIHLAVLLVQWFASGVIRRTAAD